MWLKRIVFKENDDSKELNLFIWNMIQRIFTFKLWLERIEPLKKQIWLQELNPFSKKKKDSQNSTYSGMWLKELSLVFMWPTELNILFDCDSKNWAFFF